MHPRRTPPRRTTAVLMLLVHVALIAMVVHPGADWNRISPISRVFVAGYLIGGTILFGSGVVAAFRSRPGA